MSRSNINTKFDQHDFEQLIMLAKINKVTRTEIIRRIVKAYLDGRSLQLKEAS
jgi:hypothetical protein